MRSGAARNALAGLALGLLLLVLAGCATNAPPVDPAIAGLPSRSHRLNDEALGDLHEGRHQEGIAKAREALGIRERLLGREHPDVAVALNTLAALLQATAEYGQARLAYERALSIWERGAGPEDPNVATALNNLAVLLRLTGHYADARALYERALRIGERALGPQPPEVAKILSNMSVLLEALADYAGARAAAERSLGILEQTLGPDHPDVARALNNLAFVIAATGDYGAARPLYERALRIWEPLGSGHPAVAQVLSNLGLLLRATGDYAGARLLLERSVKIWEATRGSSHPDFATGLNNLASVLDVIGDYAEARRLYEDALRIFEHALGVNHPTVAVNLNDLGAVFRLMKDYARARPLYERALQIRLHTLGPDHPAVATALSNLGYLLHVTGDSARARSLVEQALAIREKTFGPAHPDVAASLTTLAVILGASGEEREARTLYERALGIARAQTAPEWRWRAALRLGALHERAGRPAEAVLSYREAVGALEALSAQFSEEDSRARYLSGDERLEAYDALARMLLQLHWQDPSKAYDRQAWAVLEAKKGRLVAEALAAVRPHLQDPGARAAAEKVQSNHDRAAALERALRDERAKPPQAQQPDRERNLTALLAQTKAEYLAQVQSFLARYPQYRALFIDQKTVDPEAVAKFANRLPPGTLAVQYFAAPDALYLFVVAPGGHFQVKRRAVSQADLYALVGRYRQHLEWAAGGVGWDDDGPELERAEVLGFKAISRALAASLLDPIATELSAHPALILIPNDLLLYLPIHALPRADADGSWRFLAETHAVSYVTSQELVETLLSPSEPSASLPLLALGNPDGSLPGASEEVGALRSIRPTVIALEGQEATKARFLDLAAGFPDLHLATHGKLDPMKPGGSYLLMAGPDEMSRRLGVREISGLSLRHGGVAVLSACETALGEQVPGAALITLAAAFSVAGSSSIVASLWRVDDDATRDFMIAFHRALHASGRARAYQQAQLAVLRNPATAHPFYWAGFVLIGAR